MSTSDLLLIGRACLAGCLNFDIGRLPPTQQSAYFLGDLGMMVTAQTRPEALRSLTSYHSAMSGRSCGFPNTNSRSPASQRRLPFQSRSHFPER